MSIGSGVVTRVVVAVRGLLRKRLLMGSSETAESSSWLGNGCFATGRDMVAVSASFRTGRGCVVDLKERRNAHDRQMMSQRLLSSLICVTAEVPVVVR